MAIKKKIAKIIVVAVVVLIVLSGLLGLLLRLLLYQPYEGVVLEVWPRSSDDYSSEQPLIKFQPEDPGSWQPWVQRINNFLKVYETSVPEDPPRAPCTTYGWLEQKPRSPNCDIAMRRWGPCTADSMYGYPTGNPCVFLRLSNIENWKPQPYNISMNLPIPPEIPQHIKLGLIHPLAQHQDYVWVSCDGESRADREKIGPIEYVPYSLPPGFSTSYLHTTNQVYWTNRNMTDTGTDPEPLVAVFIQNPSRGMLINVECRIWTRDIYKQTGHAGRARFQLLIT